MLELNQLYLGSCEEVLKDVPDNFIEAIVTDPPYGIKFMNKKWDYQIPSVEVWEEILRVLKPGGHMLCFGGTRTYHRLVCNIEDAGFEIRDQIQWIYGSGFPKSLNIGRGIDKMFGAEREVVGAYKTPEGGQVLSTYNNWQDKHIREGKQERRIPMVTKASTKEAKKWEGWGTNLKPAYEPIVLARKPLSEKTIVANVLKWGVGGLNIDECRVKGPEPHHNYGRTSGEKSFIGKGSVSITPREGRWPSNIMLDKEVGKELDKQSGVTVSGVSKVKHEAYEGKSNTNMLRGYSDKTNQHGGKGGASRFFKEIPHDETQGRWPSNIIHDGSEEIIDLFESFGTNKGQAGSIKGTEPSHCHKNDYNYRKRTSFEKRDDFGSAARFFYCAKASPKERGKFNNHPTVKPISLLKYLIKLITPKGGTVLDPFIGSGSTALASRELGFDWIGIDQDEETYNIARRRLNG